MATWNKVINLKGPKGDKGDPGGGASSTVGLPVFDVIVVNGSLQYPEGFVAPCIMIMRNFITPRIFYIEDLEDLSNLSILNN